MNHSPSSAMPPKWASGGRGGGPRSPLSPPPGDPLSRTHIWRASCGAPAGLLFPGSRSEKPGIQPRGRRAMEVGLGLGKRPEEAAAGNAIRQTEKFCRTWRRRRAALRRERRRPFPRGGLRPSLPPSPPPPSPPLARPPSLLCQLFFFSLAGCSAAGFNTPRTPHQ